MKKFAIALAAFVSLGLAVPAFAEEKKDRCQPRRWSSIIIITTIIITTIT